MKPSKIYTKIYNIRRILVLLVLLVSIFIFAYSENKMSLSSKPSWYTVLGGQAVAKPVKTSYGFAVVSDGRLLTACTYNGEILWQKGLRQKSSPYFISGYSDTLYLVSQTGKLSMYNPSGMVLWDYQLKEYPIENLFLGKDGRLFVRGLNTLTCFSMTGNIKFSLNLGQTLPINTTTFSDGSLLILLKKEINGCSTALRISPYGKILEEITFTGKVTSVSNSDMGILVGFSNGDVGYIALHENKAKTVWSVSSSSFENKSNVYPVNIYSSKNLFFVCFSNGKISCLQSGKIIWNFETDIKLNQIQDFYSDGQTNYFVTGTSTLSINRKGTGYKIYTYTHGNSCYPFYLEPGFLVFSTPDWCINAYRIVQTTGKYQGKSLIPKSYEDKGYRIKNSYTLSECVNLLKQEDTSEFEQDILKKISFEIEDILSYYYVSKEQQQRLRGFHGILKTTETLDVCGETGLGVFTTILSLIIENETDPTVLTSAIKNAGKLCYDDGRIISAMEVLSRKQYFKNNTMLQKEFCTTLYEICRFMGKPVVLNKGKDILVYLLTGTSNEEIKIFTRQTMEKIIALQM